MWHTRVRKRTDLAVTNPNLNPLYQAIWQVQTIPKIQNFLWRALSNCLAVGSNMSRKRLTRFPECPRCGFREETVNHVLFQCPFARLVWALSPLAPLFYHVPTDSLYSNFASCLLMDSPEGREVHSQHAIWPWLIWRLWKARNEICFDKFREDAQQVMSKAYQDFKEWSDNLQQWRHQLLLLLDG